MEKVGYWSRASRGRFYLWDPFSDTLLPGQLPRGERLFSTMLFSVMLSSYVGAKWPGLKLVQRCGVGTFLIVMGRYTTSCFLWEEGFISGHIFRGWNASWWEASWWAAETCHQNCSHPGGSGSGEGGLAELLWISHLIFLFRQGFRPMPWVLLTFRVAFPSLIKLRWKLPLRYSQRCNF